MSRRRRCGKNMLDFLCDPTVRGEYTAMVKTGNGLSVGKLHVGARTRFKAKFLFPLMLNTLPAESETYNALVVMVCSGERSMWSTERITERDTAQTERILDKTCDHSTPMDGRSVSSHEISNNIAQHPWIASVPSCVVEPRVTPHCAQRSFFFSGKGTHSFGRGTKTHMKQTKIKKIAAVCLANNCSFRIIYHSTTTSLWKIVHVFYVLAQFSLEILELFLRAPCSDSHFLWCSYVSQRKL